MLTLVISDLHLGAASRGPVLRRADALDRLVAALDGADRLVLLGDLLELRDRPLPEALEVAGPVLGAIGSAMAGKPVVVVGGNHDHELVAPRLEELRLGREELGAANTWAAPADGVAARVAALMSEADVSFAYPGFWIRDDVYATHGHYLDLHLTVPRIESVAASALARLTDSRDPRSTAGYEASLAPIYAFLHSLAQSMPESAIRRSNNLSRTVWQRVNPHQRGDVKARVRRFLLSEVTIPGAVAALNRFGIGPFGAELSGEELRRSGLRSMGRVADSLGIDAAHVIFGHTHRAGPRPEDDLGEWLSPSGARLWNSGSWYFESALTGRGTGGPYWPGTVVRVRDGGPPELDNVLREVELAGPERLDQPSDV